MNAYLVHHADAVGPDVDPQRPLSTRGRDEVERLAEYARTAGVMPAAIWHSGKLRARQTAEAFYRTCNPFAEFKMVRGLLPDDPPEWMRDALLRETRDTLLVSHWPYLPELLHVLSPTSAGFPPHGIVALEWSDADAAWTEKWRKAIS